MKKFFTLVFSLFIMVFCAKAQVTVILEAHDVWGDGSGYQLLLDADHTAYGTIIPEEGPLTTSGAASAATYAEFEYKIPINADGSLTTTNIVHDGSDSISIPAGTYDFCITNPTPNERVWIASGENGRKNDYVFDTAYIYHFTVSFNETTGHDQVRIIMIPTSDDPTIMTEVNTLDFSTPVGTSSVLTVEVYAYNLTADVTVTTSAPFAVSATGSNFGTSATLAQAGGTLYIQYNPTATGTDNGIVTLSSTGATSVNITLTGIGIDCDNVPVPYITDFSDEGMNQCWTIVDYNNDGNTFVIDNYAYYEYNYAYYEYSTTEAADDWLISPKFHIGANGIATFDYAPYGGSLYPEKFEAYVIGEGQTYENATLVVEETVADGSSWTTQEIDLSAFANQRIQVAIRCISDADMYAFLIRNFSITSDPVSIAEVESTTVNVYPNPANNYINVNATSNINNVEVFTISGQKVGDFTANGTQSVISTSNLSNGMYLMRINTENGLINKKFSVVR